MADREKVIKALEICAVGTNSCEKCPLKDKCHGVSNAAMVAAIKLLKEQEPKLVKIKTNVYETKHYYCSNCSEWFEKRNLYCYRCGQAVKRDAPELSELR